jgi:hypothetical protein
MKKTSNHKVLAALAAMPLRTGYQHSLSLRKE